MNFIREAHSILDFSQHYHLLFKATADNDTPISGYIYEEIGAISFQSHQHRTQLVDFLLNRISNVGWSGKHKSVKVLLHLCKKGHFEIRYLVRQRDGELREAASLGGAPDPVLSNSPQLLFNSSIQELRSYIFDQSVIKMDEEASLKEGNNSPPSSLTVGYGSSSLSHGKYDGFGNSPIVKQDNIINQVFDFVGKVVTPESVRREELEGFLKPDKGNYQPFHLSNTNHLLLASLPETDSLQRKSPGPPLYKSAVTPRGKGHVAGRVGGGWGSDDETEDEILMSKHTINFPSHDFEDSSPLQERYIQNLLETYPEWPLDYESFVSKCKDSSVYNPFELLNDVIKEMKCYVKEIEFDNVKKQSNEDDEKTDISKASKAHHSLMVLLLFLEICLNEDLFSVGLLSSNIQPFLNDVFSNKFLAKPVKLKARKIDLLLKNLASYNN